MPPSVIAFGKLFANGLLFRKRLGLNLQDVKWGGLAATGQQRDRFGPGGAATAGQKVQSDVHTVHLLVDADTHSIDLIRWAIGTLQKKGPEEVRTKVYAPPQRALNAKWKQLFDEQGVRFHALGDS